MSVSPPSLAPPETAGTVESEEPGTEPFLVLKTNQVQLMLVPQR